MLVFVEEGKLENPEKNPRSKARPNTKLNPDMTPGSVAALVSCYFIIVSAVFVLGVGHLFLLFVLLFPYHRFP